MSLLGKIAAFFTGGTARKVCVVDGDRLVGGDRVGPGERFQALSRLSRYATREELDIKVVFGGRPLREADEAAVYNGVQVYYGESPAQVREKISKTLSSVGSSNAIFVTSDQAAESEENSRGFTTMRISTLRKAMEPGMLEGNGGREGGGGDRRDRGDRGDRGDRRGGRNRNRGRRPQGDYRDNNAGGQGQQESVDNQNRAPEGQSSSDESNGNGDSNDNRGNNDNRDNRDNRGNNDNRGNSDVKNLIDLVE